MEWLVFIFPFVNIFFMFFEPEWTFDFYFAPKFQ